jgi:hypothetical protein
MKLDVIELAEEISGSVLQRRNAQHAAANARPADVLQKDGLASQRRRSHPDAGQWPESSTVVDNASTSRALDAMCNGRCAFGSVRCEVIS